MDECLSDELVLADVFRLEPRSDTIHNISTGIIFVEDYQDENKGAIFGDAIIYVLQHLGILLVFCSLCFLTLIIDINDDIISDISKAKKRDLDIQVVAIYPLIVVNVIISLDLLKICVTTLEKKKWHL